MSDEKEIKTTLFTKIIGLFASFGLVVLSTRIWGADGRGYISIFLADAALIAVFSNILAGSSAMYYMKKFGRKKVFISSICWVIFSSFLGSLLLSLFQPLNFWFLTSLSFAISFHTLVVNQLFVNQNFRKANLLSALVQIFFVVSLYVFWQSNIQTSWEFYFLYQIICSIVFSMFFINYKFDSLIRWEEFCAMFHYGWQNELSYIFQFLSYRISYFFIYHELSISDLGVFGIMVIFVESIWVASNSISIVLFAKQLDDKEELAGIQRAQRFAKYSFWFSLLGILFILLIPNSVIISVFSKEFYSSKLIFMILAPGALAIAVSTIYGHFFAAENNQTILIKKSIAGFVVSLFLTPLLIHYYGIVGATSAMSISYLVSSVVLIHAFYKRKNEIVGNQFNSQELS